MSSGALTLRAVQFVKSGAWFSKFKELFDTQENESGRKRGHFSRFRISVSGYECCHSKISKRAQKFPTICKMISIETSQYRDTYTATNILLRSR